MSQLDERDLRGTALFKQVQQHFNQLYAGSGQIIDAVEPALSPDGKFIAFAGKYLQHLEGEPLFRLCIYDVARLQLTEIAGQPCNCRSPKWSSDGTQLAFLGDFTKPGHWQLHFYNLAERKVSAAPEVDGIVEYFVWSPDGKRILLGVAAAGADLAGAQGSGSHADDEDGLPAWMPKVVSSNTDGERRSLWLYEVAQGTLISLPLATNVWEASFAGDDALIAVVSQEAGEWSWYFSELIRYEIATKQWQTLYKPSSCQIGQPKAADCGGQIAFIQAVCSDRMIIAGDVLLIDAAKRCASKIDTLSVDVMQIQWIDERRLFFIGQRNLDTVAGEYDTTSGAACQIWSSEETCGSYQTDACAGKASMALVLQSYTRCPELTIVKNGQSQTLHSFVHAGSEYVSGIAGRIEHTKWQGRDGLTCDGLLVAPTTPGPHPLIVRVHGGPIWAFRNFWMMRDPINPLLVKHGYAIFFPNPRGSTGKGQVFAQKVVSDMCGEDTYDILAGIAELVKCGIADDKRVAVMGGSYGGLMTCWLITQTTRFAAAAAHAPVTDWFSQHYTSNIGFWDQWFLGGPPPHNPQYVARSPVFFASAVQTPTLLTAGMKDRCTPAGQAVEFHNALIEHKVPSQLVLYPEEGHHLHRLETQIDQATRLLSWFNRYLGS